MRLYADAQADVFPLEYDPPTVGTLGTNEYQSYTDIEMGRSFWDVVIPPATLGEGRTSEIGGSVNVAKTPFVAPIFLSR